MDLHGYCSFRFCNYRINFGVKKCMVNVKITVHFFDWIEKYKEEQKKILIPKLRDELGLNTIYL